MNERIPTNSSFEIAIIELSGMQRLIETVLFHLNMNMYFGLLILNDNMSIFIIM